MKCEPEMIGKWIALNNTTREVLDFDESLSNLAKRVGKKDVIFAKGLDPNMEYIFTPGIL